MQISTYTFEKRKQLSQQYIIYPTWNNRLEEGKQLPFPVSLRWLKPSFGIHSSSNCVVGEGYGYSSSYLENHNECCRFGDKFFSYFIRRLIDKLQENKFEFKNPGQKNTRGYLLRSHKLMQDGIG